jgi:hypothetical protein
MQHTFAEPMAKIEKIEGKTTDIIERRTGRVPSGAYLTLAVGSMIASALLMLSARRTPLGRVGARAQLGFFVGQWVPSLLVIGLYNKLVKVEHELLRKAEL